MKALSLWQPHAIAIGLRLKPWETRDWATDYRGPLAIQAAKKVFHEKDYEWDWFREAKQRLSEAGVPLWKLDYGKVVCIVDLVDCVPCVSIQPKLKGTPQAFWGDFSQFDADSGKLRYAFKLENVRLIPEKERPEIRGMQGFFEVPNEIALWG
jgi:hypothetical protein